MIPVLLTVITISSSLAFLPTSFGQALGVLKHREHERHIKQHLARLDTLDFSVIGHREWDKLRQSHANNILVHWPDGRQTKGLTKHIEDLRAMFVYAPDTRIRRQSVMFESGDWTCVIAEMRGTFSRPMPLPHGREISPTRKVFKIRTCAVGHWSVRGVMDEEYLFWDNQSLMDQIGVANQ